jgi:hypothetical protein
MFQNINNNFSKLDIQVQFQLNYKMLRVIYFLIFTPLILIVY